MVVYPPIPPITMFWRYSKVEASVVLGQLQAMGIQVTVAEDKLQFRPGSVVPPELIPEIKAHKQELMALLKLKGYRLKYTDPQASGQELEEIAIRVHAEGYVLLWSAVLQDLIAFYRGEEARSKIPPGFVPYSEQELWELFEEGKTAPSPGTLRLIHEAKKHGGHIISSELEHGESEP